MYSLSSLKSSPSKNVQSAFKPTGYKQIVDLGAESFVSMIASAFTLYLLLQGNIDCKVGFLGIVGPKTLVILDYLIGSAIKAVKNHNARKEAKEFKKNSLQKPENTEKTDESIIAKKEQKIQGGVSQQEVITKDLKTPDTTYFEVPQITNTAPGLEKDPNQFGGVNPSTQTVPENDFNPQKEIEKEPPSIIIQEPEKEDLVQRKAELENKIKKIEEEIQHAEQQKRKKTELIASQRKLISHLETKVEIYILTLKNPLHMNNLIQKKYNRQIKQKYPGIKQNNSEIDLNLCDSEIKKQIETEVIDQERQALTKIWEPTKQHVEQQILENEKYAETIQESSVQLENLRNELNTVRKQLESIS